MELSTTRRKVTNRPARAPFEGRHRGRAARQTMPRTAVANATRPAQPPLAQPAALVPPIYARLLRVLLQRAEVDGDRVLAAAGLD